MRQLMLPGFDERIVRVSKPCDCETARIVIEIDGKELAAIVAPMLSSAMKQRYLLKQSVEGSDGLHD